MIKINIQTQPDDETCGPTSLHAIYEYFGETLSLDSMISEVERVKTGGTIAPLLGKHALNRGYKVHSYTYNLDIFDPSWFHPKKLSSIKISQKLEEQLKYKDSERIYETSMAYQGFIRLGGEVRFRDLTSGLLRHYFDRNIPILTGLSATYLYQSAREKELIDGKVFYDDIQGCPMGHFVILCGYDEQKRHIVVADPHRENPLSHTNYYKVNVSRLINSIMLGVLTHDSNLLIVEPKEKD